MFARLSITSAYSEMLVTEIYKDNAFANPPELFRQLSTIPAGDQRKSWVLQSFATTEAEPTPSKAEAAPIEASTFENAIDVDMIAHDTTTEVVTTGIATARHSPISAEVSQKPFKDTDEYILMLIDTQAHPFSFYLCTEPRCLTVDQCREHIYAAVKDYCTRWTTPFKHTCRIVVRAFACLATDADDSHTESLLRFAVRFSAADPFFDFILAPDHKCVEKKITEALSVAAKDESCMQIFVAACYKPSQIAMLTQQNGKTTLLEGEAMHADIDQDSWPVRFGLFSYVFRSSGENALESPKVSSGCTRGTLSVADSRGSVDDMTGTSTDTRSMHNPRETLSGDKTSRQARIVGRLPITKDAVAGHVPVNKDGERVNFYMQKRSKGEVDNFCATCGPGNSWPCRRYHLMGKRSWEESCQFSHKALSNKELEIVRYHTKQTACYDGSKCRRLHCLYGHICQKWECSRAKPPSCSLKRFHMVDPKVVKWVPASD
ncbi:hypothetical protein B5807_01059 [Epicoccum nigrum]|uniref:C3H1-type domain-containing protein n=1 Tax=Epicoccum nigrum TaxID=105696 RepID=A0A1Y2MCV8_EPING|nr:hypothetical protein B5807_01059 [Epicoccum nigrum]